MNVQPLFRFQTHEKNHIQNVESTELKQKSSQRNVSMKLQQQEGDHMLALHSRLHQEADKIRKWKIQTELDLKDKVKKLTEASSQIDVMKKSLLDLQLENERTSARLQEEIEGREDMLRRINGTREMCSLLQTHASKVDDRLTKCETERTELKYAGKENMQRIEEVTKQLHEMQLAATESKKKMQSQTSAERNDRMQAEKAMKTKLDAAEHKMQKLKEQLKKKDTELCNVLVTLQEREESLQTVKKSKEELQIKVSSLQDEIVNKEEQLKESSLRISAVQDDKHRLEKLLKGLEHEFNSLQIAKDSITLDMTEAAKRLEAQLQKEKQETESTQILLEEERNKLKTCKDKLAETSALVENLRNSKDSLMMEKTDIEMQLDLEKLQINNLLTEKTEDKEEINKLTAEISSLKKKLEKESHCRVQAQDEAETLRLQMKTCLLERDDHFEEIRYMKDEIFSKQETIKSLESLLSEEEHRAMKLQSEIDKVEGRMTSDRQHLQQVVEQVDELKQEIQKRDADLQVKEQEFDKLTSEFQNLRWEKEETEKKLNTSVTELECLRSELSKQDSRIKELTVELNETNEQRKESVEQEKEVVRERDSQLHTLQRELENVKMMNENLVLSLQFCEEEMKKVKEVCQREQEAASLAIRKAEAMQENAQKERQNAIALTDCQLAEMMATLDTYKQNNERLSSEKDAKIQVLTAKLENAESLAVKFEKELHTERKEIEHLKSQIALKTKEKIHQSPLIKTPAPLPDNPRTPVAVTPMKTPQNGILRASNFVSVSKRRKVAFLPNDCSQPSSSEESDLMELNAEFAMSKQASTPLLHKCSPKVVSKDNHSTAALKMTPKRMPSCRISAEASERQIISDVKMSNLRKTPAKKMSKIFTTSPRNKTQSLKTKIKEKTQGSQMSWFELDSVYGFGPED